MAQKEQKASDVMREFSAEPKITNPRERRNKNSFVAVISPDLVVRIRKVDLFSMIMTGTASFNLLEAAQHFEKMESKLLDNAADRSKAFQEFTKLSPDELKKSLEWLRFYAVTCVIEPVITPVDDGNPDHLIVTELDVAELLGIYYARERTGEEPLVNKETAADFRRSEPDDAPEAGPAGDSVPQATQLVDYGDREGISA